MLRACNYRIHVRSTAGVESAYYVDKMDIMFDCGVCFDKAYTKSNVFITHGHVDHIQGIVAHAARRMLVGLPPAKYYVPSWILNEVQNILGSFSKMQEKTIQANLLAVEEGDEFEISHKYTVRAYKTFHRVPSLGYVVYKRQKSLKHEFINLSSAEIADIAKQGIDVNSININPEIAYTGDTRMELFHLKGCSHDGTKNDFLEAQVLITEATYIDKETPIKKAEDRGHIHLEQIILNAALFENVQQLIISHTSARYNEQHFYACKERIPSSLKAKIQFVYPFRPKSYFELHTEIPNSQFIVVSWKGVSTIYVYFLEAVSRPAPQSSTVDINSFQVMEFQVGCNFHLSQNETNLKDVKISFTEMQMRTLPLSYIKRIALNQMRRQNIDSENSESDGTGERADAIVCYSRVENRWYTNDCMCLTDICPGQPIKTLELVLRNYMPSPTLDIVIFGTQNCASDLVMGFYTLYQIRVTFGRMTWQVSRRYKDFDQLHYLLKEKYGEAFSLAFTDSSISSPVKATVNFPPKQIFGRLESDTIKRRRAMLENYLKRLLQAQKPPSLSQDVLVLSFLGVVSTPKLSNASVGVLSTSIDALDKQIGYGDIVLFSCRFGSSICQRKVTRSRFDHVGIVIPGLRGDNLRLLEATGEGIKVYPLKARLMAYAREVSERIAIRSFLVKRDSESAQRLMAFVASAEGKAYSILSIFQGLNKSDRYLQQKEVYDEEKRLPSFVSQNHTSTTQSVKMSKDVRTKETSSKRKNYFCSSLVASALKDMGWLRTQRSCSYFWPGSFEEDGEIEKSLHPGITLGKEIDVDCRLVEVATAIFTS